MFRRAMDPRRPRRVARWGDAAEYAKLFRIMKIQLVCLSSFAALCAGAKFIEAHVETRAPVQVKTEAVAGKAPSLLPPGKKWTLVWHDEFDRKEIDRTKWMCRESFWGYDFPAFAHGFEGVEMTGETVKLNLIRKGDDFTSPHLQTGSLTYDIPRDTSGFWPFGKRKKPLFMKKYGYFEIRCRQPKNPGWHAAFWLQAPGVGSHPDAGVCGVETDIMENYQQFTKGKIVGGNGWGGYGRDSCWYDHFEWTHEETTDGWHHYGCDWTPEGYTFYCDGKKVGEQNYPVSHVPQFLLVSTEPGGYRKAGSDGGLTAGRNAKSWGTPDPRLFKARLPDCFEVDFVRVYDAAPVPEPPLAHPAEPALRAWADAAWARVMATFYSPKTGGIYITAPDKVNPAKDFPGGLLKPEFGYGTGLEDCAINGGVALSGLVDKWLVMRDAATAADAAKIARGLLNLATAHPYKGFVARGLCVEDGTSICRLSSRDQVTHWMHGLFRYVAADGLAPDALKREIRAAFAAVAARMARTVTQANDWNFLQADGTPDPRGICKMREVQPHEAARLAMVYALAGKVTGDAHWTQLYRTYRAEALEGSCALGTCPDSVVRNLMPDYTLIQMNTSLEAILAVETDEKYRAKAIGAMVTCARLARERAPRIAGADTRYLCGCAEVHLAQMMVPQGAFAYGPYQRALLANAITHVPAETVGATRACHLFAAYWRAKRLGLWTEGAR